MTVRRSWIRREVCSADTVFKVGLICLFVLTAVMLVGMAVVAVEVQRYIVTAARP